jgi:purine-nucleoside phosphorylase
MRPEVGLILGSGYESFIGTAAGAIRLPVSEIPHFPRPSVVGHGAELVLGRISGTPVMILTGRKHLYEGEGLLPVVFPVMVSRSLGCHTLILTNAAGSGHADWNVGDLILIKDHLDSTFHSYTEGLSGIVAESGLDPISGGVRSEVYSPELGDIAHRVAKKMSILLREGVYTFSLGPFYESPAEVRALSLLGGDVFGMSTVPEALTARLLGLRVMAISGITNFATGIAATAHSHSTVVENARRIVPRMSDLIAGVLKEIHSHNEG